MATLVESPRSSGRSCPTSGRRDGQRSSVPCTWSTVHDVRRRSRVAVMGAPPGRPSPRTGPAPARPRRASGWRCDLNLFGDVTPLRASGPSTCAEQLNPWSTSGTCSDFPANSRSSFDHIIRGMSHFPASRGVPGRAGRVVPLRSATRTIRGLAPMGGRGKHRHPSTSTGTSEKKKKTRRRRDLDARIQPHALVSTGPTNKNRERRRAR